MGKKNYTCFFDRIRCVFNRFFGIFFFRRVLLLSLFSIGVFYNYVDFRKMVNRVFVYKNVNRFVFGRDIIDFFYILLEL